MHGPGIVFIAQRAEDTFPERLFPAGLSRARLELRRFAAETDCARVAQETAALFRRKLAPKPATLPA